MQTFLPYSDFVASAKALDYRRLGKQRVEAKQILDTLLAPGSKKGWVNHPAVRMWRGYEGTLCRYYNAIVAEWVARGYRNNMPIFLDVVDTHGNQLPLWLGDRTFHQSHQSNLVRKDPVFYGPQFPGIPNDLPYVWPI